MAHHFVGGGGPEHEALVTQVKELQRNDQSAREQWSAYADLHGGRIKDPSKHDGDFLNGFLTHLQSGAKVAVSGARFDGAGEVQMTCEVLKVMHRKSPNFKAAWRQFCTEYGGGTCDPAKHELEYLVNFFDFLGTQAFANAGPSMARPAPTMMAAPSHVTIGRTTASNGWGAPSAWGGEPAAKRMRPDAGFGVAGGKGAGGGQGLVSPRASSLAPGTAEYYVAQVKAYQRQGEQQNALWGTYADLYLNGVRDPTRHDANTLREFAVNHHLPPPPADWGAPTPAGRGPEAAVAFDPSKEPLVQRVKSYQKASKEQSELWRQFCGTTFDPARHDGAKLQEFIMLYSVP